MYPTLIHATKTTHGFDLLPSEVMKNMASYLTGVDLFQLSHVNQWTFAIISQSDMWQGRIQSSSQDARKEYVSTRSLYFDASKYYKDMLYEDCPAEERHGGCIDIAALNNNDNNSNLFWISTSLSSWGRNFAFTMWFSIPSTAKKQPSILLGSQSTSFRNHQSPVEHHSIVFFDADNNLYCSVIDRSQSPVGKIENDIWYHLALSYDGHKQQVYLNGKMVNERYGILPLDGARYTQLGTGFVCGSEAACEECSYRIPSCIRSSKPTWRSFTGYLRQFDLYERPLRLDEVESLTMGLLTSKLLPDMQFDLKECLEGFSPLENIEKRITTAPPEGVVEYMQRKPSESLKDKILRWWKLLSN